MAIKKADLEELRYVMREWNEIPEEAIPKDKSFVFHQRKRAIEMYAEGFTLKEIETRTGVRYNKITELVEHCLETDEDGRTLGYGALVPYTRASHTDAKVIPGSGAFGRLLCKYPELQEFIKGNFFGDRKYTHEKNMSLTTLHKKFLGKCMALGIQQHEYPFDTDCLGYISLYKYVQKLQSQNILLQAKRESRDNEQKLRSTGYGKRYSRNPVAPFSLVQADGHIIDMIYTVEIENEDGTVTATTATRAWLIAVIDVATRCILGYSLSQEFNYNQYDVMDAIADSIQPRTKMEFKTKELQYPANGGYYSLAFPELKNVLFDAIMLDNAKAHLATNIVKKITESLGAALNFGSVATPETRGIIERFFGTIEKRGFHRLPMTTGSNTHDLKRRSPEAAALRYNITYDQMKELMEVLIAQYNNTPHSSLNGLTPLECMRKKVFEAGIYPVFADEKMLPVIEQLCMRSETRVVRGQSGSGKRPYINFMGSEYRCNEISVSRSFVGKEIVVWYNPRDISTMHAYTKNGEFIGILKARGEFGTKSHSIKTRKQANKLARELNRYDLEFSTPITDYERYLNEAGQKSRRSATKADIVRREQGKPLLSERREKQRDPDIISLPHVGAKPKYSQEELMEMTPEERYEAVLGRKVGAWYND